MNGQAQQGCTAAPGCLTHDDQLRRVLLGMGHRTLVTLGPDGTSSHDAAAFLQALVESAHRPLQVRLLGTFDDVLRETLATGGVALVPSAYRGATTFHWHDRLTLVAHFVRQTPEYGLAVHPDRLPRPGPVQRVAAMNEVAALFGQICPPALAPTQVDWVCARSTLHAAQLVHSGDVSVAVTNDSSRRRQGLRWLARREGVDIVWLLFAVRDEHVVPV